MYTPLSKFLLYTIQPQLPADIHCYSVTLFPIDDLSCFEAACDVENQRRPASTDSGYSTLRLRRYGVKTIHVQTGSLAIDSVQLSFHDFSHLRRAAERSQVQ